MVNPSAERRPVLVAIQPNGAIQYMAAEKTVISSDATRRDVSVPTLITTMRNGAAAILAISKAQVAGHDRAHYECELFFPANPDSPRTKQDSIDATADALAAVVGEMVWATGRRPRDVVTMLKAHPARYREAVAVVNRARAENDQVAAIFRAPELARLTAALDAGIGRSSAPGPLGC
jgi:hypothetical protein